MSGDLFKEKAVVIFSATQVFLNDINFQALSNYENLTTRTTPTSALALFYSARSHEHFDLFYLSPFAKLQNPP